MRAVPDIAWPDAARQLAFQRWLAAIAASHGVQPRSLQPASADASFRRYFRVQAAQGSLIVMDAPPSLEDMRPFVRVAGLVAEAGLLAPRVLAADETQGFLLLTDLGRRNLLEVLRQSGAEEAGRLMRSAVATLLRWQLGVPAAALPACSAEFFQRELALFPQWCVQREYGIGWNDAQHTVWKHLTLMLVGNLMSQPMLAMHADWMPRNLMVCEGDALGILDFQDAMCGPLAHDLASLLRDAFIAWEEEQQLDWAVRYWQAARSAQLPVAGDFGEFWRVLEWTAMYRHLRVMGIFCRLKHRDGKAHYMADLPRFFAYCTQVALRYAPLAPLLRLLEPMSGQAVHSGYTF